MLTLPSCLSILKVQLVPRALLSFFLCYRKILYVQLSDTRIFTAGMWTSEAGIMEDGLVHRESQCSSGSFDLPPHSGRSVLTLTAIVCSILADSSRESPN